MKYQGNIMLEAFSPLQSGGLLAFASGYIILMGIITAEIYYPTGYSTAYNEISDLGSTRPPGSIIHEPSASIFNLSMLVSGLLLCLSSWLVHHHFRSWLFTCSYALFAMGILGVGIFPGNVVPYHGIFSLLTFTIFSEC